jgi:hypothetical protein
MRPYLITAKLMRPSNMKRFPTPVLETTQPAWPEATVWTAATVETKVIVATQKWPLITLSQQWPWIPQLLSIPLLHVISRKCDISLMLFAPWSWTKQYADVTTSDVMWRILLKFQCTLYSTGSQVCLLRPSGLFRLNSETRVFQTLGRTPWIGDRFIGRPLPAGKHELTLR